MAPEVGGGGKEELSLPLRKEARSSALPDSRTASTDRGGGRGGDGDGDGVGSLPPSAAVLTTAVRSRQIPPGERRADLTASPLRRAGRSGGYADSSRRCGPESEEESESEDAEDAEAERAAAALPRASASSRVSVSASAAAEGAGPGAAKAAEAACRTKAAAGEEAAAAAAAAPAPATATATATATAAAARTAAAREDAAAAAAIRQRRRRRQRIGPMGCLDMRGLRALPSVFLRGYARGRVRMWHAMHACILAAGCWLLAAGYWLLATAQNKLASVSSYSSKNRWQAFFPFLY